METDSPANRHALFVKFNTHAQFSHHMRLTAKDFRRAQKMDPTILESAFRVDAVGVEGGLVRGASIAEYERIAYMHEAEALRVLDQLTQSAPSKIVGVL